MIVPFLAFLLFVPSTEAPPSEPEGPQAELRRLTQELLDAVAPGDVAVWERLLDDRIVHMDENGKVQSKAELTAGLRPLPAGLEGRIEIDRFEVEVHGETAVVAVELQEHLDYHGQELRSRFRSVDTWRRSSGGWRLIGQHVAAVLRDPPAIDLPKNELCAYAGVYSLTSVIRTAVRCGDEGLASIREDRPEVRYVSEVKDVFFAPGQPRTRRIFTRGEDGLVSRGLQRSGNERRPAGVAPGRPINAERAAVQLRDRCGPGARRRRRRPPAGSR